MKNILKIAGLAIILSAGTACQKDYQVPEPAGLDPNPVSLPEPKLAGMWEIIEYDWHNKEPNLKFQGYTFLFDQNGIIYVDHNGVKKQGLWSNVKGVLNMNFMGQEPLTDLSHDWQVEQESETTIVMKGYSPVDNSSEYLRFRRLK
jgi:hypothetical protein